MDLPEIPPAKFAQYFHALAHIYIWRHEPALATGEKQRAKPFSREKWRLLVAYTN